MVEKLKALLAKVELIVHSVLDAVHNQIAGLNTIEKVAGAAVAVGLALDIVTKGSFGIFSFLFSFVQLFLGEVKSGGAITLAVLVVAYLAYKEYKTLSK